MQCVRRVWIPSFIRHPIRSTSSVDSYLRSYLTADSRTSLVPAIFHFYFHFYYFHSISFHIDVREIYEVQCVLSYGVSLTIHLAIMHQSRRTSPAYILASFRTQSPTCILGVYPGVHPTCIPFYIFGPILPSVISYRGFLNKSCACDIPLFYPFLLLSFHFIPYRCSRDL